jgi:hypothetical protein
MSDKKIFIALSQREARSVITAIDFITDVCLPKSSDIFYEVKQKNAASIGITAEELSELFNFGFRLGELADQQAELESTINASESETINLELS